MNFDRIAAEQEAVQSLIELYAQSRKCQQLYERAGMAVPEVLQRILGLNGNSPKASGYARNVAKIPAPDRPSSPVGSAFDWIWIRVNDASPTSMVLAVLRASKEPVRAKDIVARVTKLLPTVPGGSILNIGPRLEGKLIERTPSGWKLLDPARAGIIQDDLLWGPPEIFSKQELAAHRRDAIIHVLKHFPSGLQLAQIVEQLSPCSWVKAPVNKDLLKADMGVLMGAGKVKRRGNTKKWEVVPDEQRVSAGASAE